MIFQTVQEFATRNTVPFVALMASPTAMNASSRWLLATILLETLKKLTAASVDDFDQA